MNALRLRGAALAPLLAASLALVPMLAQAWPWSAPPRETLAALKRGVNVSGWLQHGEENAALAPTPEDWKRLRALGFTHVRIPFDPGTLAGPHGLPDPAALARLRAAVEAAMAQDLAVVLALQLPPEIKQRLGTRAEDRAALKGVWQAVALTLAGVPPSRLLLEPLNETELDDASRARQLQGELLNALRAVLPDHTLVASGARYGGPGDLATLEPWSDRNIVYTFHFYEPYAFTHQGADWGDPAWRRLAGVPYPSSPEAVAPLLPSLDGLLAPIVRWHGEQRWNAARLAAAIEPVARWSRRSGRPVWCGEFGARRGTADASQRSAWLHDARLALESRGIGWAVWDYRGGFGVYQDGPGGLQLDSADATALGLPGR